MVTPADRFTHACATASQVDMKKDRTMTAPRGWVSRTSLRNRLVLSMLVSWRHGQRLGATALQRAIVNIRLDDTSTILGSVDDYWSYGSLARTPHRLIG